MIIFSIKWRWNKGPKAPSLRNIACALNVAAVRLWDQQLKRAQMCLGAGLSKMRL